MCSEKMSFPFWTRCVDDTFTLIETSLHEVDHILQTMNYIDNDIQFTYEIKKKGELPFFDTLIFLPTKASLHLSFLYICLP